LVRGNAVEIAHGTAEAAEKLLNLKAARSQGAAENRGMQATVSRRYLGLRHWPFLETKGTTRMRK
jgi:hypothetical protein